MARLPALDVSDSGRPTPDPAPGPGLAAGSLPPHVLEGLFGHQQRVGRLLTDLDRIPAGTGVPHMTRLVHRLRSDHHELGQLLEALSDRRGDG